MHRLNTALPLTLLATILLIDASDVSARQRGAGGLDMLQPGVSITRTLTRGQIHRFNVSLQAEELVQVIVDQRGVDVLVRVQPPDGKNIQEFDSSNGASGPEVATIVSATAGIFVVEVSPISPAQNVSGQFEIRLGPSRRATAQELQITKRTEILKARAVTLLNGLTQALQDVRSTQTRVRTQLQAAGLFKTIDETASRRLIADAQLGIQDFIDKFKTENPDDFTRYDSIMQMRQQGAQLIGQVDAELALNFIRSTNPGTNLQYPGQGDQDLMMETNLAAQIAGKNAGRAVEIAEDVLSRGYSSGLVNVVSALRSANPALAARVARTTALKLMDEKLISTPEAANLAGNLLRLPRTPQSRPRTDGVAPLVDMPPLSEQDFRNLFSKVAADALAFSPTPDAPYSAEMNAARNMLNTLKAMPADAQALGPTVLPAIEEKLLQVAPPNSAARDRFSRDINSGPVDVALQSISLAPAEMRDSLYQQLAQRVAREGDVARGRQILAEGIVNPRQRQFAFANLERQAIFDGLQAGRYEEVLRMLSNMNPGRDRVNMIGSVVSSLNRGHKRDAVLGFLEQARALLMPTALAQNSENMNALLQIAMAFANQRSPRGFEILEPLIDQVNDLADAAVTLNGFGQEYYMDGELMLENGNAIGSAAQQIVQALGTLALTDFDRARQALNRLRRPEIRVAGYLSMAQQALNPPPYRW